MLVKYSKILDLRSYFKRKEGTRNQNCIVVISYQAKSILFLYFDSSGFEYFSKNIRKENKLEKNIYRLRSCTKYNLFTILSV